MYILLTLLILAIPVACISWTVTHEEVFHEFHEYCVQRSQEGRTLVSRKFFYLFTCEYCFSHYVTLGLLLLTEYSLLITGWRGYVLAFFSIVFIANVYMSLFGKIRVDIRKDRKTIERIEQTLEK